MKTTIAEVLLVIAAVGVGVLVDQLLLRSLDVPRCRSFCEDRGLEFSGYASGSWRRNRAAVCGCLTPGKAATRFEVRPRLFAPLAEGQRTIGDNLIRGLTVLLPALVLFAIGDHFLRR